MLTRSASKQINESSQGSGGETSTQMEHVEGPEYSVEETVQEEEVTLTATTEENLSSSSIDVDVQSESQNEFHSPEASKTSVVVQTEQKQSQECQSPIVNIHIHVAPSSGDSSSSPPVQPIIHVHFDEMNKNHDIERTHSQEVLVERRVQNFLSVTSTGSLNSSDNVNNLKENNNYTSLIQSSVRQRNDSDFDTSDLSNISSSDISAEWHTRKVTQKQVAVTKSVNAKKQTSQKRQKYLLKKSKNADQDKDFTSVFPKLQSKLKNLIKRNLEKANSCSYNEIKKKSNYAKYKHLIKSNGKKSLPSQMCRDTSNEPKQPDDPDVVIINDIKEVIVLSDSDTPTERTDNEEIVKEKKKEKKKSNTKSIEKQEDLDSSQDVDSIEDVDATLDVDSNQDVCRKDGEHSARKHKSAQRNVKLKKQERVKTRETRDRKCKVPTREQHMNWVKQVALEKSYLLQQNVSVEKEISVQSSVNSKKSQKTTIKFKSKSKSRSKTPLGSSEKNEKKEQNNSLVLCETPKRLSSYKHLDKRLSTEMRDMEPSPEASSSPNKRQACKDQVLVSENERSEGVLKSKKVQALKSKSKTSLASIKNNEKRQQNDRLILCETPERLSYGCNLEPTVLAEKEILDKSPVSSKKCQELRNERETSLATVVSNEESPQNDDLVSCEPPEKLSYGCHLEPTLLADKEILDKSPVSSKKPQELKNERETSLATVVSNEETPQNDDLVSCETPDRLSHGCELEPTVFADKEILEKLPVNSNESHEFKSERETSLATAVRNEESPQNDGLVLRESPEKLSYGCQLEGTVLAEKEILDKSSVNLKEAQELRNKWVNSFASVNANKKAQRYNRPVSCETPKGPSSYRHVDKRLSKEISDVESDPKAPGSSNKRETGTDQVLASENERGEEICTSAQTSKTECSESSNNKRCMTLLAESCNFSEILQKFREKHYKDKVKVFFPDKNKSNDNCHIPQGTSSIVGESTLEKDELKNESSPDDVSNVQTVKIEMEKEKSDKFENENKADENSNLTLSLEKPVECVSSATEEPPQSTHPPVLSSQASESSLNETSENVIPAPVISDLNSVHVNNENDLNCGGTNVPENKDLEKISDGITVSESCNHLSLPGNETTPEKNAILQEGNHETDDCVNEFTEVKKKLPSLADDEVSTSDLVINNDIESSNGQLETFRKELSNNCMASGCIKQTEKSFFRLKTKRKGSPDSSILDRSSSAGKKMKESKEKNGDLNKSKSSNKKVFSGDNYIPLDASGPTKFAVAPLDKVTPYREHAAKDFKGNMLYGNRVKRFQNSKSLEVYKLKQKASRKSSY